MSNVTQDPRIRRMVVTVAMLKGQYLPKEDIEIVDADAIYINFGYQRALVISEAEGNPRGHHTWVIVDTRWDRTGGVSAEHFVAEVSGMDLGVLVKNYLDRVYEEEMQFESHFHTFTEET